MEELHEKRRAVVLNAGAGAWAFQVAAEQLAACVGAEVAGSPVTWNYVLGWEGPLPPGCRSFIDLQAVQTAGDKRILAARFEAAAVATPETHLLETPAAVRQLLLTQPDREWALKWPTGCGAAGHRLLTANGSIPEEWPRPYVVQEFVRLSEPEVYRIYAAGGELFGWNVRRYPRGVLPSPWVAHVRGARYQEAGSAPEPALVEAMKALEVTGLLPSFGCVDLLCSPDGQWLVLEVNTDGLFSVVDREIGLPVIRKELDERLRRAFRTWAGMDEAP